MVLISGCCSPAIFAARAITSGSVERSGTIAASSTACWWCGIIICANITSSALWAATCSAEVADAGRP